MYTFPNGNGLIKNRWRYGGRYTVGTGVGREIGEEEGEERNLQGLGSRAQGRFEVEARKNKRKELMVKEAKAFYGEKEGAV